MTTPAPNLMIVTDDVLAASLAALKSEMLGGAGPAFDTLQELAAALGNDASFSATVTATLATKSDIGHKHPVGEITTTNSPTATTFLRGDGQWIVPTNTTYSAITEAEITAGTATTARLVSATTLKGAIQRWATGTYVTAISSIGQALNRAADAAAARSVIGAVADTDSRLTDARTPTAHTHPVTDISATGRTNSSYLRGDGTWATPSDTSYAAMTQAEGEAGTATTARTISAAVFKGLVQFWSTGSYTTAITTVGQSLNKAADAAAARAAIGAVADSHTHPVSDLTTTGTASSSTYLRGDGTWATPPDTTYSVPTQAEAEAGTATTGRAFSAERVAQGAIAASGKKDWQGTQAQYDALGTKDADRTYWIV